MLQRPPGAVAVRMLEQRLKALSDDVQGMFRVFGIRAMHSCSPCLALPCLALLCFALLCSISPTPSRLCPLAVSSPLIAAQSKVTFSAPSRVLSSWETRASRTCRISSPLPLSKRASAMSGSLMTDSALFGPCSLIAGCVRWTLLWHPSVPPEVALLWEMPRAPLGSSAHPSASTSSAVGDTAYVRDTVAVLSPDAGATALGSAFGTREQINARAWESVRACDELRSAINGVDHAPTELVLTRQCADVSKLLYHMRIHGDILDHDLLASFDGQLRASVATSLAGDLPDHSWWQATTGVAVGGLGLRTAVTVASPAFVASRILSRPLVATMVDHLCAAIGASRQIIMAEYDARTDEALSRLVSTLSTATALDLLAKLDEAYAERHLSWQNVLSGSEPAMQDQPPSAPRHARGITPDDGDGDDEHPHTRKRTKVQGIITACIDSGVREGLLQMHESEGSWTARMRLAELGDSSVDHNLAMEAQSSPRRDSGS